MPNRRQGSAYLSTHANLQNPRDMPGFPHTVVFNASIVSFLDEDPRIMCSLRYITPDATVFFQAGTYDIFAKIVAYQTGTHVPSPNRGEEQYDLMGDIFNLLPLPENPTTTLASCNVPARLSICGTVSTVHSDIGTFFMTVSQLIRDATAGTHLRIRATIAHNSTSFTLPSPTSVVSYTGNFLTFENDVAEINVDNIVYIPCRRRIVVSCPSSHVAHQNPAAT